MAAVADVPELFNAALHFVDRNVDLGRGAKIAIEVDALGKSSRSLSQLSSASRMSAAVA